MKIRKIPINTKTYTQKTLNRRPVRPPKNKLTSLQQKWYKKLKESGFNDIERFDYMTGEPLDLLWCKPLHRIATDYSPEQETYYRRIRNFVTHNRHWKRKRLWIMIAELYAEGVTYREMIPKLAKKGIKTSIWTVHKVVKVLEKEALTWNKTHPEGLDFESDVTLISFEPNKT